MTAFLAILNKVWTFLSSKVSQWVGIALAVFGAYAAIRKSGKDTVRLQEQGETIKAIGIKNEVENKIDAMSDTDAIDELHNKWER